jgi:hypothetical protein
MSELEVGIYERLLDTELSGALALNATVENRVSALKKSNS